jgi:hypothetical protein
MIVQGHEETDDFFLFDRFLLSLHLMTSPKEKVRISLDLSRAAFDRLSALEGLTESCSKADLLRDALRLYEYLVKQSLKGSRIQCVSPSGEITSVFATSIPTPVDEEALTSA